MKEISMLKKLARVFGALGVVGFLINAMLNLVAFFAFEKHSASVLDDDWWVLWFPGYATWSVMLLLGAVFYMGQRYGVSRRL